MKAKAAKPTAGAKTEVGIKRCAIYVRKSNAAGLEQEFNSLDAQREAGEDYVKGRSAQGWRLLPERYDDGGFTGANTDRPAFQRLLADIDAGKVDIVVVYKVDRLSRSLLDFAQVMDRFAKKNVAFISVTQNFSTADAIGRLTLNMLMSFAEFEREMIAARTRDKLAASRRRGKWTGGKVGLGYTLVDKHLVIVETEAVVVREVYALYLESHSILAVVRGLKERGRLTKRHEAKSGRVQAAGEWTKDAVLRILKSPLYAGLIAAGEDLVAGEHDAIVARADYDRVQAMLGSRPETGAPVRNPEYLLRGLIHCASCGRSMTPASTRKGTREYRYYRCVSKDQRGAEACPSKPLPAEAIEAFVVGRISTVTKGGKLADDVATKLRVRVASERTSLTAERRALPATIARFSTEGHQLVASLASVSGDAQRLVQKRLDEVGAELKRGEARLAEVERHLANLTNVEVEGAWVERALRDFGPLWKELTPENRARLVRAVVHRVDVDEPRGRITAHLANLGGEAREAPTTGGEDEVGVTPAAVTPGAALAPFGARGEGQAPGGEPAGGDLGEVA